MEESINSKQQQQQEISTRSVQEDSQSQSNSASASLLSPFNFIHCHKCRRDFKELGPKFYLTSCSHSICSLCFNPNPPNPTLNDQDPIQSNHNASSSTTLILVCPVCNHRGKTVWLETSLQAVGMEGLRHCFRPLPDLMDDVRQSLEFQFGTVVDQLNFFKNKVIQQQAVLSKLSTEFKGIKELKNRNARLEQENSNLRAELSNALELLDSNLTNSDPNHNQTQPYRLPLSPHPNQNQPSSSSRLHPRQGSQNSLLPTGSKSIPNNLPLQPTRLSLEPTTSNRSLLLASRQRSRNSGNESDGSAGGGGEISSYAKERISQYAYLTPQVPSRPHSTNYNTARRETITPIQPQNRPSSSSATYFHQQQHYQNQPSSSQQPYNDSTQFGYSSDGQQQQGQFDEESSHPPKRSRLNSDQPQQYSSMNYASSSTAFAPTTAVPKISRNNNISRGVTPMPFPTRGGSSLGYSNQQHLHQQQQQHAEYYNSMPPPPTPTSNPRNSNSTTVQRKPFQPPTPIQPQQQYQMEVEGGRGTPRPSSGIGRKGFQYREP